MTWALLASALFLGACWLAVCLYNAPLMDDQDFEDQYEGRE